MLPTVKDATDYQTSFKTIDIFTDATDYHTSFMTIDIFQVHGESKKTFSVLATETLQVFYNFPNIHFRNLTGVI